MVRSEGPSIGDELAQLRSLKEKMAELKQSAEEAQKFDKAASAAEEIAAGRVKENMQKWVGFPVRLRFGFGWDVQD